MAALTKADIAKVLNEQLGFSTPECKDLVDQFYEEIRLSLEAAEPVKLSGFGNFDLRDKAARPGRNPKTGETVPVDARRVTTFKVGQKLKAVVEKLSVDQVGQQD